MKLVSDQSYYDALPEISYSLNSGTYLRPYEASHQPPYVTSRDRNRVTRENVPAGWTGFFTVSRQSAQLKTPNWIRYIVLLKSIR